MKIAKILHIRSGTRLFGPERVILSLARCASPRYKIIVAGIERGKGSLLLQEAADQGHQTVWFRSYHRLDPRCIRQLARFIKEEAIDLVHSHDFKANFYALAARRYSPVPTVTTLHLWNRNTIITTAYEILDVLQVRLFDRIIAVSPKIAADARRWKVPKNKLRIILNGVDLSRFDSLVRPQAQLGKFVIGSVGRLVPQKGYDYLLEAAAQIFEVHPHASLLLVGDGPMRGYLQNKAESLGISDRVDFAGQRDPIENSYAEMDLFVSSSISEGLPVAVLEAMATRLPIVATKVGAIEEVIQSGKNGLLIEPADTHALAEAILQIIGNRELTSLLASAGYRSIAKNFSAEKMTHQTESVYEELLSSSRK